MAPTTHSAAKAEREAEVVKKSYWSALPPEIRQLIINGVLPMVQRESRDQYGYVSDNSIASRTFRSLARVGAVWRGRNCDNLIRELEGDLLKERLNLLKHRCCPEVDLDEADIPLGYEYPEEARSMGRLLRAIYDAREFARASTSASEPSPFEKAYLDDAGIRAGSADWQALYP